MKVFTTHLDHNLIVKMMKIRIKKQNKDIGLKPLRYWFKTVFDYLKSLSQKAKDLMDEIENADKDIANNKLLFIDSNKKKFDFKTLTLLKCH